MSTQEVLAKLEPWRSKHTRVAWKPIVEAGDAQTSASKFSGKPYTSSDYEWPLCNNCNQQMQFFLQLDLSALPKELDNRFGSGLLQLFYCTRGDCQGMGGWEPFEDLMSCARVVPDVNNYVPPDELHEQEEVYPPLRIVGWEKFEELPATAEHEDLGLEYTYDFKANTVKVKCHSPFFESGFFTDPMLAENIANSESGDKLSGWPFWIQGVEYPTCPKCNQTMTLLFQVDSEDNVPFMFGDSGCGHITQCNEHKDVVAFGWACG